MKNNCLRGRYLECAVAEVYGAGLWNGNRDGLGGNIGKNFTVLKQAVKETVRLHRTWATPKRLSQLKRYVIQESSKLTTLPVGVLHAVAQVRGPLKTSNPSHSKGEPRFSHISGIGKGEDFGLLNVSQPICNT